MREPEHLLLPAHGGFPNAALPLLLHRTALVPDAAGMLAAFAANGWANGWRNGIFRFHHFHSIAHEALGIAAGWVKVAFGGPPTPGAPGAQLVLSAGDVAVIPAGMAHCNLAQSADLLVVGAYPDGAEYDIRRGDPAELPAVRRAIAAVPLPRADPLLGAAAGAAAIWSHRARG